MANKPKSARERRITCSYSLDGSVVAAIKNAAAEADEPDSRVVERILAEHFVIQVKERRPKDDSIKRLERLHNKTSRMLAQIKAGKA